MRVRRLTLVTCFKSAAVLFIGIAVLTTTAQAQTYTVLHSFSGKGDGATPSAGLSIDRAGNLYGVTLAGGSGSCTGGPATGCGTAFKLTPKGSDWVLNSLYSFQGITENDGAAPWARLVFGPDGSTLYGTTVEGGEGSCTDPHYFPGCGTVFSLRPGVTACKSALCGWDETILHRFTGGTDGRYPDFADVVFNNAGNLYSTTGYGGLYGSCGSGGIAACGTVYELTPSGGDWNETVLYNFMGGSDGGAPYGGVIFDQAGNLYGTTSGDGAGGDGTVFQLTPSGSKNTLYTFQGGNDGYWPFAGLIMDLSRNLYGATYYGGMGGGGTVFKLMPSGSGWEFSTIYSFTGSAGPWANLIIDQAGNLYGTTYADGKHGKGSVFELTPLGSSWELKDLHDFTGDTDGGNPYGSLVFDNQGNLYGTASTGGTGSACTGGCGVAFKITP